jgi:hypothetical protein
MRLHTGEKPYKCNYLDCEAEYAQASNLKTHMVIHTGDRPFVCNIGDCKQTFTQGSALATHKKRHQGIKPHPCSAEGCDEAFAASSERDAHFQRNHTKKAIRRRNKKQHQVSLVLKSKFSVDEECYIQFRNGCVPESKTSYARLDFRITNIIDTIVIVECDEFGHGNYLLSCELARMTNVYQAIFNARIEDDQPMQPVLFLRYNCDPFTVDGEKVKTKRKERETLLLRYLTDIQTGKKRFDNPLNIVYLNYNSVGGKVAITLDPDYNKQMLGCIRDMVDARGISVYHKRKRENEKLDETEQTVESSDDDTDSSNDDVESLAIDDEAYNGDNDDCIGDSDEA